MRVDIHPAIALYSLTLTACSGASAKADAALEEAAQARTETAQACARAR